jgi:D-cysteine desulfhydrase
MERKEPIIFKKFPALKDKIPWMPILTNVPTPVERLTDLEKYFELEEGQIYIKRDDKNHNLYGGNKLRKFEFMFAHALKKKRKGIMTFGAIGTNHGLATAIIAKELGLKCHLFLAHQPLTWHVQRSLILFQHFGAKLHYAKSYAKTGLKSLFFRVFHPGYYIMLVGGSPLYGFGNPLGIVGFINAVFELKEQIDEGQIPEPDVIFVAGSSSGTASGLMAGCKILGLKTKIHAVAVSAEMFVNDKVYIRHSNKALKYLRKRDKKFPIVEVTRDDFKSIFGYVGSEYGIKTKRGQNAVDIVMELEGKKRGFKLETTYTGKAMAALFDYLNEKNNKSKKVLFWNTYNSNDIDRYVKETEFNWKKLPKKFHKFYEDTNFQCWQIKDCPIDLRDKCAAFLNHEYRCWKVKGCSTEDQNKCKAYYQLNNLFELEDA